MLMSWRNSVNDVCAVYVLLIALRILPVLTTGLSLKTQPLPISTRQALLDRSKALNPTTKYAEAGWSNRAATVLTPVHESGIHTADRPFLWNNIDVGCRATIVELPNDQLWVHSPVSLDGPMMGAVNQLGTAAFVVTPNYEHTKFAPSWYQNYNAAMVGCPGLAERMPEVQWTFEIPAGARPKHFDGTDTASSSQLHVDGWDTDILEVLHINIEKNPFTGKPFFNEVVFFHNPSKTLMTTDLFWNYPKSGIPNEEFGRNDSWDLAPAVETVPLGSRAWKFGMDQVYYPFYTNLMVTDQEEYRKIANHIVNVWQPEMIVPAHGDILRGKEFIRDVLTKFFRLPTSSE